MVQDTEEFKRDYKQVWDGGLLSKVYIFYSARRDWCVCVIRGENAHFFTSVNAAIAWADGEGWIKDSSAVREAVADAVALIEREDDEYWDMMDARYRMNESLSDLLAAGDFGAAARKIRRQRNRWGW